MWLMLPLACAEVAEDDGLVSWSGWLYSGPESVEEARLVEGALTAWPEPFTAGEEREGEQPYDDYAGYWEVRVPADVSVNVRIEGAEARSTVWAGSTPGASGNWFAGALFAAPDVWLQEVLEGLSGEGATWLTALDAGQVLVLGLPANEALGCEALSITGEGGLPAAPACWSVDDEGVATRVTRGPITWFLALAPPGEVVVEIGTATERYRAEAGDVVMAWYLSEGAK
ncbi:hypothetical protein LBMAG42_29990 [Deltaproteobacteria bacterium]|nr:hypothetical protein LBMAG42_29990 [Deltaproteobacteria bacterium]